LSPQPAPSCTAGTIAAPPSPGPSPPTRSCPTPSVNEIQTRDTSSHATTHEGSVVSAPRPRRAAEASNAGRQKGGPSLDYSPLSPAPPRLARSTLAVANFRLGPS